MPTLKRKVFLTGAAALFAAGCSAKAGDADALRIVSTAWHGGMDPYASASADVIERSWIFGDGLVGMGLRGLYPRLALAVPTLENGGITEAGRCVRYTLRPGVRWHDGRRFAGDDAVDAFTRLVAAHPVWKNTFPYSVVADIDAGKEHVRVRIAEPHRAFVGTFFAAYGSAPLPIVRPGAVGTGPFALRRHTHYQSRWDRTSAKIPIASLSCRAIPDSNSAIAALESGEADAVIPVDRTLVLPWMRTVARRSGVVFLLVNARGGLSQEQRRDLLSRVDTRLLARKVYAEAPTAELAPGISVNYAGTRGPLGDMRIQLVYPHDPVMERFGTLLAADLRAHGISVRERAVELRSYDAALRDGDFDVAVYGAQYTLPEDLYPQWSCASSAPAGGGYARLCDPALDRAMRAEDAGAIARRLALDAAVLPIAGYDDIAALSDRVRLPAPRLAYVPWFADLGRWSIGGRQS